MRKWRKTHQLSGAAKRRDIARSYANVYLKRGLLEREPCADCEAQGIHMHHEDYSQPLAITWLCDCCHGTRHDIVRVG